MVIKEEIPMETPYRSSIGLKISVTLGILMMLAASRPEIMASLSMLQQGSAILTPVNIATILIAVGLLLAGLISLLYSTWAQTTTVTQELPVKPAKTSWLMPVVLLLFVVWFLLFSQWQNIITGFWTRFLFLISIAGLIALPVKDKQGVLPWREAMLAIVWLLYVGMVQEARQMTPLAIIYRGLTVLGAGLSLGTVILLYYFKYLTPIANRLTAWRDRIGRLRWFCALLLTAVPVILLYVEGRENYAAFPFTRLSSARSKALRR
jgi:hypothetical protein